MVNLNKKSLDNLLIPVKKLTFLNGMFSWPKESFITSFSNEDNLPLQQIKNDLLKYSIKTHFTKNSSGKIDLIIIRDKSIINTEGYSWS